MYSIILYESINKNYIFNNLLNAHYVQGYVMWELKRWIDSAFYFYEKPSNSISFGDLTSGNKKQPLMVISPTEAPHDIGAFAQRQLRLTTQYLSEPENHRI